MVSVTPTAQDAKVKDKVLDIFVREIREQLGDRLKQIILFGSRARGDYASDSDYDCLVVFDEVSPEVKDSIDEIAGELLYRYDTVFSIFPILEKKYHQQTYDPLLMNVRREGIVLWMSEKSYREQIRLMIQKAARSLTAAQQLLDKGHYDFASSRAYYAAFYAMQAVILTKNLSLSKHTGVISAFNQHFVKTGVFPTEFGKAINQLFRERQTGDYEFDLSLTEDEAKEDIQLAERTVHAITAYLTEEGVL
jgi:uncharacterized protein (UPF0332 family)/predicted nucleotidyltransferase